MEFLLPANDVIDLMNKEYEKALGHKSFALSYIENQDRQKSADLLLLYFIGILIYNNWYGTKIHDAHGSVGGLRPGESAFRNINNLDEY